MKIVGTFLLALASLFAMGTAQVPDILIYENDTINLYANPLESYYNKDNPRPEDFGVGSCWSTACWRRYQATWQIIDDKLYLIEIASCCGWGSFAIDEERLKTLKETVHPDIFGKLKSMKKETYDYFDFQHKLRNRLGNEDFNEYYPIIVEACEKPYPNADLAKLFGEHYKDGKVHAFWYSGDLRIPKGDMISYVHMGYMSEFEKELVLTIENGIMMEANEYENKSEKIKKGYGVLQATSYSIVVPLELLPEDKDYLYTESDTISYSGTKTNNKITALAKFNDERTTIVTRKILVESTIDSISKGLSAKYQFSKSRTEKMRGGTASWVDGYDSKNKEMLRIFTMSNINSQVIVFYKELGDHHSKFLDRANYITNSVQLMEFGY